MRVLVMYKGNFDQDEYSGVTSITTSGTNVVIAGTVAGNPFTKSYAAANVLVFILSLT